MNFFGSLSSGFYKGLAALAGSILAFGLFSTAAVPTASFTMTPAGNPVVGQTVVFTDTSTGSPTSWTWNFGDGQFSNQQSPTHVYNATGPFNVTLTAMNQDGSSQQVQPLIVSPIDTLRLNAAHPFLVTLVATNQHNGNVQGPGQAIPQNDLFGYFSLPSLTSNPDNPEVFVKILDGRPINGEFWVFYGHLTDLIYDITVTEVATGHVKTYHKDAGNSAGGFDTSGFAATKTPTPVAATATPTPTPGGLINVGLQASDFQWDFDGGGDSFTFHVGQQYRLTVSRAGGTQHQFSGISGLSCSGSSLVNPMICTFTPTSAQIGIHGFGCTNSGCGSGHDSMSASGQAIVAP
jgi:PKD repeat protein